MTRALIALSFILLAAVFQSAPAAVAPPAPIPAVTPPPGKSTAGAICRLRLEGHGTKPGLKSASLSCTGGTITAAAAPELLKALGDSSSAAGVEWSDSQACKQAVKEYNCLLVLCDGSSATFVSPLVTRTDPGDDPGNVLCIIDSSNVAVVNGTFADCTRRPVLATGNNTAVHIRGCRFLRNDVSSVNSDKSGGAISVVNGFAAIHSTFFQGNKADGCGAVIASEGATLDIDYPPSGAPPTVFVNNSASATDGFGGHLCAQRARVRMYNTTMLAGAAVGAGAMEVDEQSSVTIVGATIADATAELFSGGIDVDGNSSCTIIDTVITGCKCTETDCNGGGIDVSKFSSLTLVNTTLSGNEADNLGGGLHATGNATLSLQGATLVNNSAWYGGGLSVTGNASLVLRGEVRLLNNYAFSCGGGLELGRDTKFSVPDMARYIMTSNNSAPQGPDTCAEPKTLQVVSISEDLDNFVASVDRGGGLLTVVLNVSGPQGMASYESTWATLYDSRNLVVLDQEVGKPGDLLRQATLKIQQPPGSYRLKLFTPDTPEVSPVQLSLRIIPCPVGYITANTGSGCSWCVKGYFSFDSSDNECSMCVQNARCPGGAVVSPAPGFWHSAPRSVQMHRCMNPAACPGVNNATTSARNNSPTTSTTDYKAAQCAEGYSGNLCGSCSAGHGKSRPFVCRKCMSRAAIVALYLTAALGMLGLVKLLVYFATAGNDTARPSLKQPLPVELLKVLVLHCQWLFIMSNLVGIPWPATVLYPLQAVAGIWSSTSGSSLGFECILPRNSIPVAIQKVLICLLTPVGILCVVLAVEGLLHLIKPRAKTAAVHHEFASLVVSIVFLFLPAWVSTAFSLFTCVQLDTQPAFPPYQADAVGSYWAEDMNQRCYAGYHRGWSLGLGIPLVLLFCVVLPAGVFVFMWLSRKRGRLAHTSYQRHYGFLYKLWREEVCWWESVVVLQTIGLVMVSTFGFALGSYYQGLVTLAVLGVVLTLLLWVRPFKCAAVNTVAVQSACVLLLTAYTALTFLPFNSLQPGPVYGNIMGVVLVLLNVVFLAATVWKLFRVVDWSAARQFVCGTLGKGWVGSSLPAAAKQRGGSRSRTGDKCVGAVEGPPPESKDVGCGGERQLPK